MTCVADTPGWSTVQSPSPKLWTVTTGGQTIAGIVAKTVAVKKQASVVAQRTGVKIVFIIVKVSLKNDL